MKRKKVIVADNNLGLLNLFERQLRASMSSEYQVIAEEQGRNVLFQLEQQPQVVDVLVVGDVLPDMSGLELVQEARTISPHTQIFLMSSLALRDLEKKAGRLHLELDGYLNKTALYLELLEMEGRTTDENSRWSIFET